MFGKSTRPMEWNLLTAHDLVQILVKSMDTLEGLCCSHAMLLINQLV